MSFGTLDFRQTNFTLNLLKRDVKSKIIQAPKIITLDHHEATIFVGKSISFAQSEIQQQDNGQTTIELSEAPNSPATQGFQILVIPHIIPDRDKVQVTIILVNNLLTGSTSTAVPGFNRFESQDAVIDLPETTQQVVLTHMILESGQTAVLGGLVSINQTETVKKVPFLGDIPFLGYLFKSKSVSKEKEDLFIFVTPRIVASAEDTERKMQRQIERQTKKQNKRYDVIWQDNDQEMEKKDTKKEKK